MPPIEAPRYPFTSSMTRKGQVTIPAHIRELLGLTPKDRVAFLVSDGRIELTPASTITSRTAGALKRYAHVPGATPQEEKEAFGQAVADEVADSMKG